MRISIYHFYPIMSKKSSFFSLPLGLAKAALSMTVLFAAPALGVTPQQAIAQSDAPITVVQPRGTMASVMETIEKQTGLRFFYNDRDVDLSRPMSISVREGSLGEVLDTFHSVGLSYEIKNGLIVLSRSTSAQQSNTINVKGQVVDKEGMPIMSATIIVLGVDGKGGITDMDGNFTITGVPKDATLRISYVGMVTQEVKLEGRTSLTITLHEDSELLDEVVVVGYGTQKKVNLTGSVASVDGEELSKRPVVNVSQSLQGVVPGLNVSVSGKGGTPGSDFKLQLRGQGNLSGSDSPYVLVDGVEMSLADVNPNDIENISVLKDAAASAIYGARAAYGVILITTKKGAEGKVKISYQGNVGFSQPTHLPKMANGYEFAQFFNAGTDNTGLNRQYYDEQLALLKRYVENPAGINSWPVIRGNNSTSTLYENNSRGIGSTDWFRFHYKDIALKHSHNVGISGGNKGLTYYISGGYYDENGLLRYADINFRRFNFNSTVTATLTDWLKVNLNSKYTLSNKRSPLGEGGLNEWAFYHGLARFRATVSPYDLNGEFSELSQVPYLQSGTYTDDKRADLVLTGGVVITPLKGWTINADYTYKTLFSEYEAQAVPATFTGIDGTKYKQNTRTELRIPDKGSYLRRVQSIVHQNANLFSNYSGSIAEDHNFTLLAGMQSELYTFRSLQVLSKDQISEETPGINLGTGEKTPNESRFDWATRGFFARLSYDYKGRYLAEFNGRYDGSSRFKEGSRWGFFPSISLGWNIAHEDFMQPISDTLNSLKLRGSYGWLGNQSGASLYTFAQTMGTRPQGSWIFKKGREMIINAPGAIADNVTWEKVESINVGLDFGLFNNALTGSFDWFNRTTRDMLGPSEDVPDMFGAAVPQSNNAVMRSRGWELSVNYRGKIAGEVDYSIGGMLSDARTVVLEYSNPSLTDPRGNWYPGREPGEIWGYLADGLIQTQEEADEYNKTYDTSKLTSQPFTPGDVKFRDLNGDKAINYGKNILGDMGDMTIIGNSTPRFLYSLNGLCSYKGISLSILLQGVGKRQYAPGGSSYFSGSGPFAQVTVFKEHLDYWTPENKSAYYPKPYISPIGNINSFRNKTVVNNTDRYLLDASYLRVKNVTLSYDLPESIITPLHLSKLQLYFSGENLFTLTRMPSFYDPELVFVSSDGGKNYPMNRIFTLGMSISL